MNYVGLKAAAATAIAVAAIVIPMGAMTSQNADATDIPIPDVTVTVTDLATIKVPGETITVRVPGPTRTVTIPPSPQTTVTVRPPTTTETVRIPGPTQTVTVRPDNTRPTAGPTEAPTQTVTVTPEAGQTPTPSGRVDPDTTDPEPSNDNQTIETVVKRVAVGLFVTLIIAGLGILALFFGYLLGRKDGERNAEGFYRTLLGIARGERQ